MGTDIGQTRPRGMSIDVGALTDSIATARSGLALLRTVAQRTAVLEQIDRLLREHADALTSAVRNDLGLSAHDVLLAEVGPAQAEAGHALDRIAAWTRTRRYGLPLALRPGRARGARAPRGAVLIIAPVSSPLQQLIAPMVTAIAAGNAVLLKPSSRSTETAALLTELLGRYLDRRIASVISCDRDGAGVIIAADVDHVVFSGSAAGAGAVHRLAADRATSVTSTAGSKNPVIVAPSADVAISARRIVWGKFLKAGQSCSAPDYALVPRAVHGEFIGALNAAIGGCFGREAHRSRDYGRIASLDHVDRLVGLIQAGGYQAIAYGGRVDRSALYVEPTVLSGVRHDAAIMRDEIFGPVLPVLAYEDLNDVVNFVAQRPRPLVTFVFGRNRSEIDRVVAGTRSGSVMINHTLPPSTVRDVPIDGSNADRGEAGFYAMSQLRPVVARGTIGDPAWLYPPSSTATRRALRRLL